MGRRLRVYLMAMRPLSFTAAVIPVLVGTAVAADEAFRPGLFVLTLLGSMGLQGGTNLINDYYDHQLGTDTEESLGPSGVIQLGFLSPREVLFESLVVFAIGIAIGLVITAIVGWPILILGAVSVIGGFFYTAPPVKLAYRALGEVTSFAYMGVIIVMGASYVQVEAFTWRAFLAALPVGLLTAAILHANNLRDIEGDRAHGKRTLASLVGRPRADYELAALVLGAFALAIVLPLTGGARLPALIALAALPLAVRLLRRLQSSRSARSLNRVLIACIGLHMVFGLLWALGLAIDAWTS